MGTSLCPGWRVGHWTDDEGRTGCTVLLPPPNTVAACDVRGSSPSSRELAMLDPERRLTEIHGILLTGGSAFGLAAADGVMAWLAERDIGYRTPVATVPIVPAAVIFDLGEGRSDVRPGPDAGRAACDAATEDHIETGRVGAGAGATVGKWAGVEHGSPGGLGIATRREDGHEVGALAVVNAVGDVLDASGAVLRGSRAPAAERRPIGLRRFAQAVSGDESEAAEELPSSTVLSVLATRSALDKRDARWLAARGSDGITISVRPAHTRYDGDVVIAAAPLGRSGGAALDVLGRLATDAVAAAVRAAVAAQGTSPAPAV
jgi:L-aminopeptidase/D-esterase-like protein